MRWKFPHKAVPERFGRTFLPVNVTAKSPYMMVDRWWQLKDFLGIFTPISLGK